MPKLGQLWLGECGCYRFGVLLPSVLLLLILHPRPLPVGLKGVGQCHILGSGNTRCSLVGSSLVKLVDYCVGSTLIVRAFHYLIDVKIALAYPLFFAVSLLLPLSVRSLTDQKC